MPKFNKTEDELETHFDKWLYMIKNLPVLDDRPKRIQERIFQRLFEVAEISRFDSMEREAYEESIKVYRDLKNVLDTQWEEGYQKGVTEGLEQIAKAMKSAGEPIPKIATSTGLTEEQIRQL